MRCVLTLLAQSLVVHYRHCANFNTFFLIMLHAFKDDAASLAIRQTYAKIIRRTQSKDSNLLFERVADREKMADIV
jgi:hypothetical protein